MFAAIKTAIGSSLQTASVLKKEDGTVIEKRSEELERWVKFYNFQSAADHVCIDDLPDNPTKSNLNQSSDADQYNQKCLA